MPFFGLVWVASWVSCFFPSHQALLKQPRYLSEILPLPIVSEVFDRSKFRISLERIQATVYGAVSSRTSAAASPHAAVSAAPVVARSQDSTEHSTEHPIRPGWLRVATLLFSPSPEARSTAVIPVSYSPPSAPTDLAQMASHSVGLMQNLVLGWRLVAGVPRSHAAPVVTVNSAPWQGVEEDCKGSSLPAAPHACVSMPAATASTQRPTSVFQVRVKNQVIAEAASYQQASQIAQQLRQMFNDPRLDPTQLQPGFDRKVPAGRLGDRVLFTVDRSIATAWGCHAEILAVRWVNALRSTLDEAPIPLADAQAKMHNLRETDLEIQGLASWYGPYFHGRQTATGEIFDQDALTAAHPSLPFDTFLKVTNLKNGKTVIVRVNDRGPYFDDRTLDLSLEAARLIDSEQTGVVPVSARIMQPNQDSAPPQSLAQL